jgi:hypothetical protein
MGFFDALRRVLGKHETSDHHGAPDPVLAKAWGLDEPAVAVPQHTDEASAYDLAQWVKRLKRLLEELPASKGGWAVLMADAKAMHFDPKWIREREYEEFHLMVRRAVSERKFTEAEHRRIDLARDLMKIPEAEAESILHTIVAEAETFFGRTVEGA